VRLELDLLGGARYVRARNEIEARLAQIGRDVDETFDWVDAVVGARFRVDVTETVSFSLSGDVGGFEIGSSSDFTWSGIAALTWQPWERWSLSFGYKVLDIDRDKIDIQQSGPALGATYRF
jgi:outer membrane receptor protein involved in Fe transport